MVWYCRFGELCIGVFACIYYCNKKKCKIRGAGDEDEKQKKNIRSFYTIENCYFRDFLLWIRVLHGAYKSPQVWRRNTSLAAEFIGNLKAGQSFVVQDTPKNPCGREHPHSKLRYTKIHLHLHNAAFR